MFFCISFAVGVVLLIGYDLLRALRRVFTHSNLMLAIEDFCYWTFAGIASFCVIFLKNDGVLRGFSLAAIIIGMILYHKSLSPYIVKSIAKIMQVITDIVKWILHVVLFPVLFLSKKMRKIARKTLKKKMKEVKMVLSKK